jgi:hypothetical protein
MVAILLTNAHTILHEPQTSQYFWCKPPSLCEYFHGEPIEDEEMDELCTASPWREIDVPLGKNSGDDTDGDDPMSEI